METVEAGGLAIGDGHPPRIMGVVNVSPESPYAPSVFGDPGEAARYVDRELVGEGADIVDVGLASANKRFEPLTAEAELDRLDIAIQTIESVDADPVLSIETRYHEVAAAALDGGFDVVNDVCGFADPDLPRVCEEHDAAVVKMASPPDLTRPGAVEDVDWAEVRSPGWARAATHVDKVYEALRRGGFTGKTIVDPAFGGWSEAKTLDDDRETLRRLREFRGLGRPILVSINRKNFLRTIADRSTEEALPASLAATSMAVERGANVVRTHDVAGTRDAALIGDAFARDRITDRGLGIEELDVTTTGEASRHLRRIGADARPAREAVTRTFELTDLSAEARRELERAVDEYGGAFADGSSDSGLLLGTPRSLAGMAAAVDEPPDLATALETIAAHVEGDRGPDP